LKELADRYEKMNDYKSDIDNKEFNNRAVYEKLKKEFA